MIDFKWLVLFLLIGVIKEGFFNMWEKDWHMRQFTS